MILACHLFLSPHWFSFRLPAQGVLVSLLILPSLVWIKVQLKSRNVRAILDSCRSVFVSYGKKKRKGDLPCQECYCHPLQMVSACTRIALLEFKRIGLKYFFKQCQSCTPQIAQVKFYCCDEQEQKWSVRMEMY